MQRSHLSSCAGHFVECLNLFCTCVLQNALAKMSHLDFIIKVGGGAITNKKIIETPQSDVMHTVSSVLAKCYEAGLCFVILHGAG